MIPIHKFLGLFLERELLFIDFWYKKIFVLTLVHEYIFSIKWDEYKFKDQYIMYSLFWNYYLSKLGYPLPIDTDRNKKSWSFTFHTCSHLFKQRMNAEKKPAFYHNQTKKKKKKKETRPLKCDRLVW